jgi:hypothetical protein
MCFEIYSEDLRGGAVDEAVRYKPVKACNGIVLLLPEDLYISIPLCNWSFGCWPNLITSADLKNQVSKAVAPITPSHIILQKLLVELFLYVFHQ